MSRQIRGIGVSVILMVALGAPVSVHSQGTLIETGVVDQLEFHDQVVLVGRTEARINSEIVAEVSGRVIAINALEGTAVRRGAALVTVDSSRFVLAFRSKEAEVVQAEQQAFLARANLKRAEELYQQKLVPTSTIDSARAWAASMAALRDELAAERDRLRLDLEHCVIRAPYSGYTLRRTIDVGEWVDPGTPVYNMVDVSEITVQVDLPERYYGAVAMGSSVDIIVSGRTEEVYTGTVSGIARSASAETHTFPIMVKVPNKNGELGGGKLVRARLNLDSRFTSLAVHKDALVRNGNQTLVYTIADDKAVPISVVAGSTQGEFIAVSSDQLAVGMAIVVRGNERIFPGAPVRIQDTASQEGQSALTQQASAKSTN